MRTSWPTWKFLAYWAVPYTLTFVIGPAFGSACVGDPYQDHLVILLIAMLVVPGRLAVALVRYEQNERWQWYLIANAVAAPVFIVMELAIG